MNECYTCIFEAQKAHASHSLILHSGWFVDVMCLSCCAVLCCAVQMDSGEIEVFNAYRVQHNNSRGPFKVSSSSGSSGSSTPDVAKQQAGCA